MPKLPTRKVAARAAAASGEKPFVWGANMKNLSMAIGLGVLVYFSPHPAGITDQAWHLLAVFLGTIVGIITKPVPLGAVAVFGLGAAVVTNTLTFAQAFSGFANEIPWLIAIAFWLSGGFIKSGLGNRIAYSVVAAFGSSTLGLTYSLVAAEALLAPAIPSLAARAGGITFPLARALCVACGSDPKDGTEGKLGSYLMLTCFQCTCVTSAMFITAMAANPLVVNLASALGYEMSWGLWALGGIVPGLVCLAVVPAILYALYPPEVKATPDAPGIARAEIEKLGPLSRDEKITAGALGLTVFLWVAGGALGVNSVAAAIVGLFILIVSNVVTWKECLNQNEAWDTLSWFAALIAMAGFLNKLGLIAWFSGEVSAAIAGMGLSASAAFGVVALLYFYSHYLFASAAAHIGAMYTAFLSVAVAAGSPGLGAALALGYLSSLMGCLTNYGIGSAPSYFGSGYVSQADWYKFGLGLSVVYLAVWLGLGPLWWKVVGIM